MKELNLSIPSFRMIYCSVYHFQKWYIENYLFQYCPLSQVYFPVHRHPVLALREYTVKYCPLRKGNYINLRVKQDLDFRFHLYDTKQTNTLLFCANVRILSNFNLAGPSLVLVTCYPPASPTTLRRHSFLFPSGMKTVFRLLLSLSHHFL